MSLSRRKILGLIGGGIVLAAGASATGFALTRTPNEALSPWALAGTYPDARLRALSYGLLAPNPHNMQPWLAELIGEDRVRLHRNWNKALPHTDPFNRQITIGLGCFIELTRMAAAEEGLAMDVALFPEGGDDVIADLKFAPGGVADPLFVNYANRRSCKEAFEDRAVPNDLLARVAEFADVWTDTTLVERLRDFTFEAWVIEAETPRTYKESVDVMRFGFS